MTIYFSAEADTIKAKLDSAFNEALVQHEFYHRTFERCAEAIAFEEPDTIIAVVGPSGVGKSALMRQFHSTFMEHHLSIGTAPGEIPAIQIEIPSTEKRPFPWRPVYQLILEKQEEPLVHRKCDIDLEIQKLRDAGMPIRGTQISQQTLPVQRRLIERNLSIRNTRVLIFDEAQHIAKVSSENALQDQMDHLKSLTNGVDTRLVLFGTGEMIELLDQSAQLARRTCKIGFDAYGMNKNERIMFASALKSLFEKSPIEPGFSISQESAWIHEQCAGLFGVASSWVRRACALALLRKNACVELSHFDATKPDTKTQDMLIQEVNRCSNYLNNTHCFARPKPVKPQNGKTAKNNIPKRRVGRANPSRHPVGNKKKVSHG